MLVLGPIAGLAALLIALSTALTPTPLDPQVGRTHWEQAIVQERLGDLPGALRESRLALASDPTRSAYYDQVASISGTLMVDALGRADTAEAKSQAEALAALGAQFKAQFKAQAEALGRLSPSEPLTMTPDFQLRYGQALFLIGQMAGAEAYLSDAAKTGLLGAEAHVWLYVMYEQRGDKVAMAALADKPWIRFRAANPVYKSLKEWVAR